MNMNDYMYLSRDLNYYLLIKLLMIYIIKCRDKTIVKIITNVLYI